MAEYIDREAAMKAACKALCHEGVMCPDSRCKEVREVFDDIPAADVREVNKLTEAGKRLLKYCPEIINELAAQIDYRLESFVINGECADLRGEAE